MRYKNRNWLCRGFYPAICVLAVLAHTPNVAAQRFPVPHAEAARRARTLVSKMTLSEKVSQLHGLEDAAHQRIVPGIARLGIPDLRITNGPAGVGPGGLISPPATAFPAPIAIAATWDPDLARLEGKIMGEETRSLGSNLLEAPDINIARVPQGGRVFESYGEDPYLAATLAVANIEGIQSTWMIANVKHFAANNQEQNRHTINEIVDERALREIYLPAFEASIKEGHSASLMCAYPQINGQFACENTHLLRDILLTEWGYDGFITSDFGAVHSAAPSLKAGLDLELPTGIYLGEIDKLLASGDITTAMIDDALIRRFTKMIEFGWFEQQAPVKPVPVIEDGKAEREMAAQSMVLLKNDDDILPLKPKSIKSIALLGPYAVRTLTGGGGSSHVIPLYDVDPYEGLYQAYHEGGVTYTVQDGSDIVAAANAAKKANIAIVMVGQESSEGKDHKIELDAAQNRLIEAVAKANPKTIVVLKTGSAVLMPWLQDVAAVLEAWYPGEEDGNAVADVLVGAVNPSGKLPLTFPRHVEDTLAKNPDTYPGDGQTVHYSENLEVGYRSYIDNGIAPLFPFGFGLSYTQFRFADLAVEQSTSKLPVTVKFRLTNVGKVAGAELAQLYIGYPAIEEGNEPQRQLRGFRKVFLRAGETQTVTLELPSLALSYWSVSSNSWQLAHGKFQIMVGSSSEDLPLTASVDVP